MKTATLPKSRRSKTPRILTALLDRESMSFSELVTATGFPEAKVNKELRALALKHLVLARTVPDGSFPVRVRYFLSKRGEKLVRSAGI